MNNPANFRVDPAVPAKKFRRHHRVTKLSLRGERWFGTVLNPENHYFISTGRRNISVRWDHQHPWEKGHIESENEVELDTTGGVAVNQRRYDLSYLSHDDIALLKEALENVNIRNDALTDEGVQAMLKKLPELPS